MAARHLRIGILDLANSGWTAGGTYTRMLVESLSRACRGTADEVCVIAMNGGPQGGAAPQVETIRGSKAAYGRYGRELRRLVPVPDVSNPFWLARKHGVSVVLPAFEVPRFAFGSRAIGWIPDFQHVHLPRFFSDAERAQRDRQHAELASRCDALMLSSHDACRDARAVVPHAADKFHVIPFPSLFAFSPPAGDPSTAVGKYHLPAKFALIANQFWAHKNHAVVVEALALLRSRGVRIPVVMTGLPNDPRDPQNATFSALLQRIVVAELQDQVFVLGRVPYEDLVSLMRSTALLIQPSRCEGWNTTVQDVKALGRPMICSDVAVHREQAPHACGFFGCDDAEGLARLLADAWPALAAGPDAEAERQAIAAEQDFARAHGASLLALCRRVARVEH